MRTEQEMLELILSTAREDDRIRAVIMNGSRTNPNATPDVFQDYDIVYLVTDIASFTGDHSWIDCFGERMILQLPDLMGDVPDYSPHRFAYLIQLLDGNRIDLTLYSVDLLDQYEHESLRKLLLDKDGLFEPFPPPDESDYLPQPPDASRFGDTCNEFWWVAVYVAKGIWREQLTYARFHLDVILRGELMKMLNWYIGTKTDFTQGIGKSGKSLKQRLDPELWSMLEQTYADADYDHTWDALLVMGDLFRQTAVYVAEQHGFDYPHDDDRGVSKHLRYVRSLPPDATDMNSP